jgi:hypothetical protein
MTLDPIKYKYRTPRFLLGIRDGEQAQMDGVYVTAVSDYLVAARGWIDNQTRLRELSAEPEEYRPTPFTREIPQREIVEFTENTERVLYLLPVDPRIQPPVIPPYVKPETAPSLGIVSTVAEKEREEAQKDEAVFRILLSIQADLRVVKARLGIA